MRSIIFFSNVLMLFISCKTPKVDHFTGLHGVYENDNKEQLVLKGDNFVYLTKQSDLDLALYKCCDTISYGQVNYLDGLPFIYLSSSKHMKSELLEYRVVESRKKIKDSIKLLFKNPIENHYKKFNESYRELYYRVQLMNHELSEITSDVNPIIIASGDDIKGFEITVYMKYDIPLNNIGLHNVKLRPYKIINPKANVFEIEIPKLDYSLLAHKRLYNDYVRVINNKELIWDDKKFRLIENPRYR